MKGLKEREIKYSKKLKEKKNWENAHGASSYTNVTIHQTWEIIMKSMGEKETRKPKNKLLFERTKKLND